ncbi:MAG: winged helix DNA-binding domain-containing protein, partial [Niveispirillum sp.]|nr:winged helix DNA-binding domain-containing protein [Niveispirillum sp.]
MMTAITLPQALSFRLNRQHLTQPAADALIAARTLIGAQAQVHSAAILQLRARSAAGAANGDIDRALYQDRSLVKLWAQRSTLHLT